MTVFLSHGSPLAAFNNEQRKGNKEAAAGAGLLGYQLEAFFPYGEVRNACRRGCDLGISGIDESQATASREHEAT